MRARFPTYRFGMFVGPAHMWFAWRPVRLWYGRFAWLRWVNRRRVVKKSYLDGPDWAFWSYTDA